jgi:D-3-phosphoglycerate dehydrogenase
MTAKFKVLLTDDISKEALAVFADYPEIEVASTPTLDPKELARILPEYSAVIVRSPTKLTKPLIEAGTQLKFIGRAGVGVDNIDVETATARRIIVMNSPGGNTVSTAEHTIALIMALARRVPQADRSIRAGRWDKKELKGVELSGKTLGVIGLGRVGREVAKRMLAFSMRVIASDPYVAEKAAQAIGVRLCDLDTLLAESDFITIHVVLGAETRRIISKREIDRMRPGVFIVNCARGGVIDESAAKEALDSGKIAGLALDVYEKEPPGPHPLFAHERSVFTPHLGAATKDAQIRVAVEVARNVADALCKGEIRDAVNAPAR